MNNKFYNLSKTIKDSTDTGVFGSLENYLINNIETRVLVYIHICSFVKMYENKKIDLEYLHDLYSKYRGSYYSPESIKLFESDSIYRDTIKSMVRSDSSWCNIDYLLLSINLDIELLDKRSPMSKICNKLLDSLGDISRKYWLSKTINFNVGKDYQTKRMKLIKECYDNVLSDIEIPESFKVIYYYDRIEIYFNDTIIRYIFSNGYDIDMNGISLGSNKKLSGPQLTKTCIRLTWLHDNFNKILKNIESNIVDIYKLKDSLKKLEEECSHEFNQYYTVTHSILTDLYNNDNSSYFDSNKIKLIAINPGTVSVLTSHFGGRTRGMRYIKNSLTGCDDRELSIKSNFSKRDIDELSLHLVRSGVININHINDDIDYEEYMGFATGELDSWGDISFRSTATDTYTCMEPYFKLLTILKDGLCHSGTNVKEVCNTLLESLSWLNTGIVTDYLHYRYTVNNGYDKNNCSDNKSSQQERFLKHYSNITKNNLLD